MKRAKILAAIFLAFTMVFSMCIPAGAADQTMFWPGYDNESGNYCYIEKLCLGEISVGENTGLTVEDGYYSFIPTETGYYIVKGLGILQISLKVEGNKVTESGFSHWIKEEMGAAIYCTKGETCYLKVQANLTTDSATVSYIGTLVSAVPESTSTYTSQYAIVDEDILEGILWNYPMTLTFSGGKQYSHDMWSGKIDTLGAGRHHLVTAFCHQTLEIDVDFIDYSESVVGVVLPEDFYAAAVIRYMGDYGLYYMFGDLPASIEFKFDDGSSYTAHPKSIKETWKAEYSEIFTIADGSSHRVTAGYDWDENGRVYFYTALDGVIVLKETESVVVSSVTVDFIGLCQQIRDELRNMFKSDEPVIYPFTAMITTLKNIVDHISNFIDSRAYAIKNGYTLVPVRDIIALA
ncbi:MAG: hypothetical protein K5756_04205 [Clostridiales bacterium]|nr:hypothetical protein [Clostridiales bacterium]